MKARRTFVAGREVAAAGGDLGAQEVARAATVGCGRRERLGPVGRDQVGERRGCHGATVPDFGVGTHRWPSTRSIGVESAAVGVLDGHAEGRRNSSRNCPTSLLRVGLTRDRTLSTNFGNGVGAGSESRSVRWASASPAPGGATVWSRLVTQARRRVGRPSSRNVTAGTTRRPRKLILCGASALVGASQRAAPQGPANLLDSDLVSSSQRRAANCPCRLLARRRRIMPRAAAGVLDLAMSRARARSSRKPMAQVSMSCSRTCLRIARIRRRLLARRRVHRREHRVA